MDQHPLLEMHLRGLKLPTMLGNCRTLAGEVAQPIESFAHWQLLR